MAENENNSNAASHVGGMKVVDSSARSLISALRKDIGYIQNNIDDNDNNDTNLVTKINELITKVNKIGTAVSNLATAVAQTTQETVDGTEYGWINVLDKININTQRYAYALHILGRYVNKIIDDKAVPQSDPNYNIHKAGDPNDIIMNLNKIADTSGHFMNNTWQTVHGTGPADVTISATITTDIDDL